MNIQFRILCLIFLFFSLNISGQDNKVAKPLKRNTSFVEAGGQSLYASISYDRLFSIDKKTKTSISCGLAVLPLKDYFFISTPISYNFLLGQKNHHLELGSGLTFLSESYNNRTYNLLYLSPKIAYRFQQPTGGVFFKFSFVPTMLGIENYSISNSTDFYYNSIIYNPDNDRLNWWFGLGAGWTFK